MKKNLTTIILAVVTLYGYGQNLAGTFLPRANDEICRQTVTFSVAGEGAENILWDFSGLEPKGNSFTVTYTEEEAYEGLIVGTEFNTRHYYQASTDSLLLRGYENNLTKVEYDRPELLLHLPLTYGERQETLFHGTAAHHRGTDSISVKNFFEYDFNRSSIDKRRVNTYGDFINDIKRRLR